MVQLVKMRSKILMDDTSTTCDECCSRDEKEVENDHAYYRGLEEFESRRNIEMEEPVARNQNTHSHFVSKIIARVASTALWRVGVRRRYYGVLSKLTCSM